MNRTRRWLAAAALVLLAGTATAGDGEQMTRVEKPVVISLGELRATIQRRQRRPLMLHVWASWCQPCVHELPLVVKLLQEARARGVEVYSVSLDEANERAAARMARTLSLPGGEAINRTILRVDDADALLAQVDPAWEGDIPAFFAYDKAGKLRRAHVGEMTREGFDRLIGDLAAPIVKK